MPGWLANSKKCDFWIFQWDPREKMAKKSPEVIFCLRMATFWVVCIHHFFAPIALNGLFFFSFFFRGGGKNIAHVGSLSTLESEEFEYKH